MIEAATFWDEVENLHLGRSEQSAVQRLREVLEPHWQPVRRLREHPLANQLLTTWRSDRLLHLAKKLNQFVQIEGSERVLTRLGSPGFYLTGSYEMDFALKMRLSGHGCKLIGEDTRSRPDLLATLCGRRYTIEVTSLNAPQEDRVAETMASTLDYAALKTGSRYDAWVRVPIRNPRNEIIEETQRKILEAAERAKSEATALALEEPLLTVRFVSPQAKQHFGHAGSHTEFDYPNRPPKEEKLRRKIEDKARRQLLDTDSSLVVVYDRMLSSEDELRLASLEFGDVMGGFPTLGGVLLVHPFVPWGTEVTKEQERRGTKFEGRYPLPDGEAESFIAWCNPSNAKTLELVVSTLMDFPKHLERLYNEL
jgi:hypothetical protein